MDNLELGTCIKDTSKKVLYQDDTCIKACGNMQGMVCDKGCMTSYLPTQGMSLVKNLLVDNTAVDAVIINDGKNLTTLLYPHSQNEENFEEVLEKRKEDLISFGLSKSEVTVFLLVMTGKKNRDIQDQLFISKSTLKTHLNNIYKKLPESFQQYKARR